MLNKFIHSTNFWSRKNFFDLFQLVDDLSFVQYCSSDYQFYIKYQEVSIICIKEFQYVTLHILKCFLTIFNDFIRINLSVFVKFGITLFDFLKVLIKDFGVLKREYFWSNFLEVFQGGWESAQFSNLSLSVVFGIAFKMLNKRSVLAELREVIQERFYLGNPLNNLVGLCNLRLNNSFYHFGVLKILILLSFHIKHSPHIFDKSIPLNHTEVLNLKQFFDWELLIPQILSDLVNNISNVVDLPLLLIFPAVFNHSIPLMIYFRILDQFLHHTLLSKFIIWLSKTEIYQIFNYPWFFILLFELLINLQKFIKRIIIRSLDYGFNKDSHFLNKCIYEKTTFAVTYFE